MVDGAIMPRRHRERGTGTPVYLQPVSHHVLQPPHDVVGADSNRTRLLRLSALRRRTDRMSPACRQLRLAAGDLKRQATSRAGARKTFPPRVLRLGQRFSRLAQRVLRRPSRCSRKKAAPEVLAAVKAHQATRLRRCWAADVLHRYQQDQAKYEELTAVRPDSRRQPDGPRRTILLPRSLTAASHASYSISGAVRGGTPGWPPGRARESSPATLTKGASRSSS